MEPEHEIGRRTDKEGWTGDACDNTLPLHAPLRQARVLLIEDDDEIAEEIAGYLTTMGYHIERAPDGAEGLRRVRSTPFQVLILDRMLPGMDGLAVLEHLRAENVHTPALVLSALSSVDDRIRGLRAGGDDYLSKPFALGELAARIEALLRRPLETRETVLRAGSLELDLLDRVVRKDGCPIELLPREFRLLEYLVRRAGQLVTREMLLENVWHYRFVPQTNLVDVHVGKLRRKLDPPGGPSFIRSIRGSGFVFGVPD